MGPVKYLVNGAGVSPSQASIETILKVDLYGTAVLLEEVGKVIEEGGAGIVISSQSGFRMKQLTPEEDRQLALTPTEELLDLPLLAEENIETTLQAYQLAKRCNEKRVMGESVKWGARGARLNDITPGIIVTPLALDEFNGIRGDFYKNMFAKSPAGRPGTAGEVAELLMSDRAQFITGATFLVDGGATASYYYLLRPATTGSGDRDGRGEEVMTVFDRLHQGEHIDIRDADYQREVHGEINRLAQRLQGKLDRFFSFMDLGKEKERLLKRLVDSARSGVAIA